MRYWTYSEIKDKVRGDLGIEQEEFVSASEMMGYCNAAIDDAESDIHSIYEDYFLTTSVITTVADQSAYTLPENIYASKIRGVVMLGSNLYTIKRYSSTDSMFEVIESDKTSSNSDFKYLLTNNSAASGIEMELVPVPRATGSEIKLYYIRNSNRMVDSTSLCDIPEFVDYIIQFMKVRCYEKEGHPNTQLAVGILEYKKKNMINTLSNMVPDGDNLLQQDASFYFDMGDGVEEHIY